MICVSNLAMEMFTKAAAFLVTTAFPYVCKYLCSLNWNEFRRCFLWEGLWNEGSISLKTSKAVYTMLLPSTCEMLVYKLVTCIETSITSFGSFFFPEKFMKFAVTLRYDLYCCAIGRRI